MKKIYLNTQRLLLLAVAMFLMGSVFGQITITGTVLDGKFGGGLPGANVTVKGTTNGTITDLDGNYTIKVQSNTAVLVYSFIGYAEVQKTVGSQTKLDVTLNEDVKVVEEVVKIGYGVAKKQDITSAITSVSGDDLSDKPVLSADQALQGRAAGVQVRVNSGAPGGDMKVNIRGLSSLTGDSKPLYVVDGVAQDDIKGLNPGDIKSMAILKDASACAIYGSRAAYGVIIITTKDGGKTTNEEVTSIEFNAYRGVQSAWNRVDVMNAQEYMTFRNSINPAKPEYTEHQMDSIGDGIDWQDQIFREAVIESYQISVRGAAQKTSYSVGGSYFNQDGIIKGSNYKRYTAGIKASHKLFKNFILEENLGLSISKSKEVPGGGMYSNVLANAVKMIPTEVSVYDTTSSLIPILYRAQSGKNPVGAIESVDNESNNLGIGGYFAINYEVMKGLTLRSQPAFSSWNNQKDVFKREFEVTPDFKQSPNELRKEIIGGSGWSWSNTATYNKALYAKKEDGTYDSSKVQHNFVAMVGTEATYNQSSGTQLVATGVASELESQRYFSVVNQGVSILQGQRYGNMPQEKSVASYLGRIEYGFSDKYNLNATFRYDGSSSFGSEERWGMFPSFGAAWKIHQEDFFKNQESLKFINEAKLRFGWGIIGSQNATGPYDWAGSTTADQGYIDTNGERVSVVTDLTPPNPYLKWEESETYNMGLDLAFLKNKITFSSDFYIKNTNSMITKVPVAAVAGISAAPNVNFAEMQNTGVDFSISYSKKEGEFNYNISGNISTYKNEVTNLGTTPEGLSRTIQAGFIDGANKYANLTAKGHSVGEFYGYKTEGIYDSWEEINAGPSPLYPSVRPGDVKIVDVNGDGKISEEDMTFIGSPHPDFIYGFNFDATYKSFDFSLALSGSQGNMNFNAMKYFIDGDKLGNNQSTRRLNAWTADNHTDEPYASNDSKTYLEVCDRYVEDGSYLRLQSVQLGYTISDDLSRKLKISKLRVYVQAQNLLTITSYSGFDPEVGSDSSAGYDEQGSKGPELGVDRGTYPIAKTYLVGLNFNF